MQETKNTNMSALIGGILFAVMALFQLIMVFPYFTFWGLIRALIYIVVLGGIAFTMITKRRDIILPVALAVMAVLDIIFGSGGGFSRFLLFLGEAAIAFMAFAFFTNYVPQARDICKKLWFVPMAVIALMEVIYMITMFTWLFEYGYAAPFYSYLMVIVSIAAFVFVTLWIVDKEELAKLAEVTPEPVVDGQATQQAQPQPKPVKPTGTGVVGQEGYCDMLKHILLLFFTFGIWLLIWIYRMTGYTNAVKDEQPRDQVVQLILCMFVPFYSIYWVYVTAQRVDKLAASKGVPSDLGILCLILAIFVAIVPPIILQDKMNAIVKAENGQYAAPVKTPVTPHVEPAQTVAHVEPAVAPAPAPAPAEPKADVTEELKKYKELLDGGVITEEEFDAKKKQLLGL